MTEPRVIPPGEMPWLQFKSKPGTFDYAQEVRQWLDSVFAPKKHRITSSNCWYWVEEIPQADLEYRDSPLAGKGVFSCHAFKAGQLIFSIIPAKVMQPLNHINHSCSPNCGIHLVNVYALRDIAPNEELTINYRMIKFSIDPEVFDCQCGARNCSKKIHVR